MSERSPVSMGLPSTKLAGLVAIGIAQAVTVVALVVLFGAVIDVLQAGTAIGGLAPLLGLLLLVMTANAALRGLQFGVAERIG
ncbi:MAG: hypothetical protein ABIR64_08085, partial [Candidatus Limnocylindrales bacterium]